METGTIVEHKTTGRQGVVVNDNFAACTPEETPVVFWGTTYFEGTPTSELDPLGEYQATPNLHKCGAGRKAECCIFLTMGPNGVCCERFSSMRDTLIFKVMSAERNPPEPFPDCMIFPTTPNTQEDAG